MLTTLDSRILDANAQESGINMEELMDNAGRAVANLVASLHPLRVLVSCGSGNNGGDGYVAAAILTKEGIKVSAHPVLPPSSDLCKRKYSDYVKVGGNIDNSPDLGEFDVIIDALLGVGISGTPREPYCSYIERLNGSSAKVVSVDIPSGFMTECSVDPEYTVTMQFKKAGMNESNCGEITVADVGFPRDVVDMIGPGDLLAFPSSRRDSHKGENGISVIIGGSKRYFGAPIYMAKSSLRMGPDLVILFAPSNIHNHIASNLQDIIIRKSGRDYIEFNYDLMKTIKEKADSVAIGPGISKDARALEEAARIIDFSLSVNRKMVIDADALATVNDIGDFKGLAVLTPHRGEFKSTFDMNPDENSVMKVAKELNAVILLKGETDLVSDGTVLKKNTSYHHQSMTRGGTGDLVTGAIAGLLSRGVDPLHSASLASYVIGKAGIDLFNRRGYSYLTSEIVDAIPDVFMLRNDGSVDSSH